MRRTCLSEAKLLLLLLLLRLLLLEGCSGRDGVVVASAVVRMVQALRGHFVRTLLVRGAFRFVPVVLEPDAAYEFDVSAMSLFVCLAHTHTHAQATKVMITRRLIILSTPTIDAFALLFAIQTGNASLQANCEQTYQILTCVGVSLISPARCSRSGADRYRC